MYTPKENKPENQGGNTMKTIRIYNTLTAETANENGYWKDDPMNFMYELGAALDFENMEVDLADYADELEGRVKHITIGTKVFKGKLYGEAACTVADDWTDKETEMLKEYLTGQYADGWGEGFEQRAITDFYEEEEMEYDDEDGEVYYETEMIHTEVYIHFWQSEGYKIMTEEEFMA